VAKILLGDIIVAGAVLKREPGSSRSTTVHMTEDYTYNQNSIATIKTRINTNKGNDHNMSVISSENINVCVRMKEWKWTRASSCHVDNLKHLLVQWS